jgi:hypothetical protein
VPRQTIDLTGKPYGKWTVQGPDSSRPKHWLCVCDPEREGCGRVASVHGGSLRGGRSTQCASCASKEKAKGVLVPNAGLSPDALAARQLHAGNASRVRHGLPPAAPDDVILHVPKPARDAIRALCDRAERDGWDAARLIAGIRKHVG